VGFSRFDASSWTRSVRLTRRAPRQETGVAAVETAIIAPLLLLMVIGIVEFGLYFWNTTYAQTAVSAGARTGVTQARVDDYQLAVKASVKAAMSNISARPISLTVYKADPTTGLPAGGTSTSDISTCLAECYRFSWNASTKDWVQAPSIAWPGSDQAACGPLGHNDYLGVAVKFQYQSLTGILLKNQIIFSSTMMRLEPVSAAGGQSCEP
jgi:Flp pilus assembly protein TadG